MQDFTQSMRRPGPDHRMSMVRHYHPGVKFVSFSSKVAQGLSYNIGTGRTAKVADAKAAIEVSIHPFGIPTEQFLLFVPGERSLGGKRVAQDGLPFML